ncbi:MAG: hypothetical protein A4S12_13280, partial [Proteobacteria bacterium SG_bin5]
ARLGLARDARPAAIARAAVARFGLDTPAEMLGEWSLATWRADGAVTLMLAAERRERLFVARGRDRLAWSPDPHALARLAWVDRALDATGLLLQLGRAELRAALGWRGLLAGIDQLPAGGALHVAPDGGETRRVATVLTPQPRFTGSLADALAETEALLRHILRERLPHGLHPGLLLSGGLDSSLLAWLIAAEAPPGARRAALCSAAPPGSGIADEVAFASLVAARHGFAFAAVAPPETADPYLPDPEDIAGAAGPFVSNRHCINTALRAEGERCGAVVLVNGTYGEMTLTARLPGSGGARERLGALRRWLRGDAAADAAIDPFHVMLAPARRAALPDAVAAAIAAAPSDHGAPAEPGLFGYRSSVERGVALSTRQNARAARMIYPFRDPRLLRLFAGMPEALLRAAGADRGMGRRLARGHLPEVIRARRRGRPADPGHYRRLRAFAPAARARIAGYRAAGVGDWLDLDRLDTALARVAAAGPADVVEANQVQMTALAAEFLLWFARAD